MNTATTLINAATLTAAAEQAVGASVVDLNAITVNDIIIEASATSGATSPGNGRFVDVYFAFASAPLSSNVPITLWPSAQKIRVLLATEANGVRVAMSDVVTKKARYGYVWYSHENLDSTVSLTVKMIS